MNNITLIGFGEAGSAFARAGGWGARAAAFDIDPNRTMAMAELGVTAASSSAEALSCASLVLSLVTADQTLAVARNYAPLLAPGAIWCDFNSVAPQTKREAARLVEAAGCRYADVAVLAPVNPAGLVVPLLISGPCSFDAEAALRAVGFMQTRVVGAEVGRASMIKMIRSVMVKGIEALAAEMMAAAEAAGVTEEVLASLDNSERNEGWARRTAYSLERMAAHGLRRAAEMEEAAKTLAALGVEPVMTEGAIRRQREMAGRGSARTKAA